MAGITTEQVFLLDEKEQIVGTISATLSQQANGVIDIYFYDEVVDYFTLLSQAEIKQVHKFTEEINKLRKQIGELKAASPSDAKIKELEEQLQRVEAQLVEIVEPKRSSMMKQLFAVARQHVNKVIAGNANGKKNNIRAFIRAAAHREKYYLELGCKKPAAATESVFVIHGAPTPYFEMIDKHVKTWADKNLALLAVQAQQRKHWVQAIGFSAVGLIAAGIFAKKIWDTVSGSAAAGCGCTARNDGRNSQSPMS